MSDTRDELLAHLDRLVSQWAACPGLDTRGKLRGLVGNVLATLEGCCGAGPTFIVAPADENPDLEVSGNLTDQGHPNLRLHNVWSEKY